MYAYPRTAFKVESGKKYVLVCAGDKEEIGFFTKESKFAALLIPLEEFEKIELGVLVKGKS